MPWREYDGLARCSSGVGQVTVKGNPDAIAAVSARHLIEYDFVQRRKPKWLPVLSNALALSEGRLCKDCSGRDDVLAH